MKKAKKGIKNPYLQRFKAMSEDWQNKRRNKLVLAYSWAVPNREALGAIAQYTPNNEVVEMGAGTGYWAYLLSQMSITVYAWDKNPYHNRHCDAHWGDVMPGGPEKLSRFSNIPMLLVWPPYDDDMATKSLLAYKGNTLIYVGEGEWGCCANDSFFDALHCEWKEVENIEIPQFQCIHDSMSVFKRLQT